MGFLDTLDKEDAQDAQTPQQSQGGLLDSLDAATKQEVPQPQQPISNEDNVSVPPATTGQVQQNVTPIQGLGNLLNAIGGGFKQVPNAIVGMAKQEGQNLKELGGNLATQPLETIASIPGAFGYGVMQGVRDLAQGATDVPFALANAYQGKEAFKNPIQLPDVGNIKDIYGVPLKDKYPGMGTAKTLGSFVPYMIPGAGAVKAGAEAEGLGALAKSAGAGTGIGFVATPGDLQSKVAGAGAVGLTGAALHGVGAGIKKYNDLNLDTMTNKKLNKIYDSKTELQGSLTAVQESIDANKSLTATHRSGFRTYKNG